MWISRSLWWVTVWALEDDCIIVMNTSHRRGVYHNCPRQQTIYHLHVNHRKHAEPRYNIKELKTKYPMLLTVHNWCVACVLWVGMCCCLYKPPVYHHLLLTFELT